MKIRERKGKRMLWQSPVFTEFQRSKERVLLPRVSFS